MGFGLYSCSLVVGTGPGVIKTKKYCLLERTGPIEEMCLHIKGLLLAGPFAVSKKYPPKEGQSLPGRKISKNQLHIIQKNFKNTHTYTQQYTSCQVFRNKKVQCQCILLPERNCVSDINGIYITAF